MRTLPDFNALPENEKADAVWQGRFLADREEDGFRVQLYSLPAFYVEVFYDALDNKITEFRAFSNKQFLAPYLAQIKFI
jgi:hypothetical protein